MTLYEGACSTIFAVAIMAILLFLAHIWPEIEIRIRKERKMK